MDRRSFNRMAAIAAAGSSVRGLGAGSAPESSAPESFILGRNGWMPNNDRLPVVLYRGAITAKSDLAAEMERILKQNGWPAQWRDGVYDFHHYDSTTHEVLGFAGGWGRLMLGGEGAARLPCTLAMWLCCRPEPGIAAWRPARISWWSAPTHPRRSGTSAAARRTQRPWSAWRRWAGRTWIRCTARADRC